MCEEIGDQQKILFMFGSSPFSSRFHILARYRPFCLWVLLVGEENDNFEECECVKLKRMETQDIDLGCL